MVIKRKKKRLKIKKERGDITTNTTKRTVRDHYE